MVLEHKEKDIGKHYYLLGKISLEAPAVEISFQRPCHLFWHLSLQSISFIINALYFSIKHSEIKKT